MIGVIAHPELAPDHRRHPLGGPDIASEAERLGALRQQQRQLLPLLVRQPRGRAWRHPTLQRLDTALTGAPHPLADRPGGHSQGVRNRLLAPILLLQFPGAQPPPFTPVHWCSLVGRHTQTTARRAPPLATETEISI
jgi:hypothetical protein